MRGLSALPRVGLVALTALGLAAAAGAVSLYALDRVVEHRLSELQAYAAGDTVDRLALLDRDEGVAAVAQAVRRAAETASPEQIFLVLDAQGRKLGGNLPAWPAELRPDEDWEAFRLPDGQSARAITATFPGGERLLIGQSDASRWSVRRAIGFTAAAAFAALVLALVGVAATWGRLIGGRLERLATAARAIAGGDRSKRLPSGPGDAFDDLARALNQMVDENMRLVGGLEAVTRSLAHDLRTPLMRMRAAIAEARSAASDDTRETALARAEERAEETVAMFTGLADLALAESGVSREAMQTVGLDGIVADAVELFEPLAEERGQTLRMISEPIAIVGHRQLLFQAIANLLGNAIQYGPAGSEIELRLARHGAEAEIVVRDHGPGLTMTEAAEAVRPFVRLSAASGGLGLGLAIVNAVARLHDGRLELSPAQPGLRATLRLATDRSAALTN